MCEEPKPPNSMIFGYLSPVEPLFIDFNIPRHFKTYKTNMETFSEIYYFYKPKNLKIRLLKRSRTDIFEITDFDI